MFSKQTTAALAALFLVSSVSAGDCVRSYTIQENDICDSISDSQGVSTYQLATINYGFIDAQCSNLMPGDTICLGYAEEDCTTTHTVTANETCEGIVLDAGIDIPTLYVNNPQINDACTNIYVGQVLCTVDYTCVPPVNGALDVLAEIPVTALAANPPVATPAPEAETSTETETTTETEVETETEAETEGSSDWEESYDDEEEVDEEDLPYCDELDDEEVY